MIYMLTSRRWLQIGLMCGALFVWMADWYGRKKHMFFGCLGVCAGTIINALSTSVPMFIGSRFIMSFFVAWATIAAPMYLVEIAPAAYRGTIAGLYNTFYYVVGCDSHSYLKIFVLAPR